MNQFNIDVNSSENTEDDKLTQDTNCLKIHSDNPLEIVHGSNKLQDIPGEHCITKSSFNDNYIITTRITIIPILVHYTSMPNPNPSLKPSN